MSKGNLSYSYTEHRNRSQQQQKANAFSIRYDSHKYISDLVEIYICMIHKNHCGEHQISMLHCTENNCNQIGRAHV